MIDFFVTNRSFSSLGRHFSQPFNSFGISTTVTRYNRHFRHYSADVKPLADLKSPGNLLPLKKVQRTAAGIALASRNRFRNCRFGNDPPPSRVGILETAVPVAGDGFSDFFSVHSTPLVGVYTYDGFTAGALPPRNRRLKKKIAEHLEPTGRDRWEFASRGCDDRRKTRRASAGEQPVRAPLFEWVIVTFMPRNYTFFRPSAASFRVTFRPLGNGGVAVSRASPTIRGATDVRGCAVGFAAFTALDKKTA